MVIALNNEEQIIDLLTQMNDRLTNVEDRLIHVEDHVLIIELDHGQKLNLVLEDTQSINEDIRDIRAALREHDSDIAALKAAQ